MRPSPRDRLEGLLREAAAERATDLHLEPREDGMEVRLRIDGRLVTRGWIEAEAREALVQAAKIAGRMDIAERRLPQDGQGELSAGDRRYHLRFSCLPSAHGEAVAVRLIDGRGGLRSFEEMGIDPEDAARLRGLVRLPAGLVYVTGPTGSGKTTLLHALLHNLPPDEIAELKVVTLEDPVEIRHARAFLQVGVDDRIGRGFGELLRHVLRHDPDIILVGETRDRTTAEITLKAALTGHLCLSTLHTADALGAVARLAGLGLDPLMLSSALRGVVAQRLVRRPCARCRRPHPQAELLRARYAELCPPSGEAFCLALPGQDCPICRGRGHHGRIAILEVFPLEGLGGLVAERARPEAFLQRLRPLGCRTLFEDGIRKAALGLTTVEEVHAAVDDPEARAGGLLL